MLDNKFLFQYNLIMKNNYSAQRDTVYKVLQGTKSHPTAELIYGECRKRMPAISKVTVYRNLALLAERGDIIKVVGEFDSVHYDATVTPHCHTVCPICGAVDDCEVSPKLQEELDSEKTRGSYISYGLTFTGVCARCAKSDK